MPLASIYKMKRMYVCMQILHTYICMHEEMKLKKTGEKSFAADDCF
jgi:hypothetical protein